MNKWIQRHKKDFYVKNANKLGYRSRASFKLIEIQDKFNIINKQDKVLDLGAAPGSWSQVAVKLAKKNKIDNEVYVYGIDLLDIKPMTNAVFFKSNCKKVKQENIITHNHFDVILSDMAPCTSGDKTQDHFKSIELCYICLDLVENFLLTNGNVVMKLFQGKEDRKLFEYVSKLFSQVKLFKPKSSRKESIETYIIGLSKYSKY